MASAYLTFSMHSIRHLLCSQCEPLERDVATEAFVFSDYRCNENPQTYIWSLDARIYFASTGDRADEVKSWFNVDMVHGGIEILHKT